LRKAQEARFIFYGYQKFLKNASDNTQVLCCKIYCSLMYSVVCAIILAMFFFSWFCLVFGGWVQT